MSRKRRIVMTGGGTAGHVMPNIALLPELLSEDYLIAYIGSHEGIEKQLIRAQNIRYYGISSGKLRRYMSVDNFKDPFKVIKGYFEAKKILKKLNPDVVFSKGGFVSVPVCVAAGHLGIPLVIHESDMTPGLANKIAMRHADKICCTFPETMKAVPAKKSILTGTPIRAELFNGNARSGHELTGFEFNRPVILVVGGSTGAKGLNDAVRNILPRLLKSFNVLHLCGAGKTDPAFDGIKGYIQLEYADKEMPDFLAMADLIISRAGANAIFEFLALKKPNILIPLPASASRGDQLLNAESFEKKGYSIVMHEEDIKPDDFLKNIVYLYNNKDKYIKKMASSELLDSVQKIVDIIDSM